MERVAKLTRTLCRRFGVSERNGLCAAWAHDIAREWPPQELLAWSLRVNGPPEDPPGDFERRHPVLLHGAVAARLLVERFDVRDPEVLSAVRHHTLGHPDMGLLARVLFVADYFEPGRSFLTAQTRAVTEGDNLDEMVCRAIEDVIGRGLELAPVTAELYRRVKRQDPPRRPPQQPRQDEETNAP